MRRDGGRMLGSVGAGFFNDRVVPAALLDCFQSDRVVAATIGEFVNAARPQRHLAVVVFRVRWSFGPLAIWVWPASALMRYGRHYMPGPACRSSAD